MKRMALVLCLVLLQGCGGGSSWTGSNANEGGGDTTGSAPSQPACCKVCSDGKACGDSCIDKDKECHQPTGCACDASPTTSTGLASIKSAGTTSSHVPLVGIGKLDLLSGLKYKSGHEESVVSDEGTYTYEMDKPVSFLVGNIKVAEVGPGVNMRRLNLNNLNTDPKATINTARLLITLDKDADPYNQGIVISPETNAQAENFYLDIRGITNLDSNSDIIKLIAKATNTSSLVPMEYANDYLIYLQAYISQRAATGE